MVAIAETFIISLISGYLLNIINFPLAWMLGPMVAVLALNLGLGRQLSWPQSLRNAGLIILGYMMGLPFTYETAREIFRQFTPMVIGTVATVLFGLLLGYVTARRTGVNLPTSIMGSVPGGFSQMVMLSEEVASADMAVVTLLQTARLFSVIFIVPFLTLHGLSHSPIAVSQAASAVEGYSGMGALCWHGAPFIIVAVVAGLAASKLGLPTPYLLGPMIGIAALTVSGYQAPPTPKVLTVFAQISAGAYMGTIVKRESLKRCRNVLPYALLSGIGVVFFSLALGYILTLFYPYKLTTAFLSTAPGGIAEMGLTAVMVNADLSVVAAFQTFRLLFILLIFSPALKWWFTGFKGNRATRSDICS